MDMTTVTDLKNKWSAQFSPCSQVREKENHDLVLTVKVLDSLFFAPPTKQHLFTF